MLSIFAVLAAMLSIQAGASLAKTLFPILGAGGTTCLRIGFAAILLCLVSKPWRPSYSRDQIQKVLIYGTALGVMNILFYLALERIPLGIAVALEFVGPLAVALLASRQKLDFLWALLAAVGIFFVLPIHATADQALDPIGILMALAAGACWGFYIIFGKRLSHSLPADLASCTGMLVAALVALPFGIATAGSALLLTEHWPLAFGVAVLSSALPYSIEMRVLKVLPTKTFGILMSLEPAFAAISGFVFLKENLNMIQMGAIVSVMTASLGSTLSARNEAAHGNS
jgi:inner membrane transporter RhtA